MLIVFPSSPASSQMGGWLANTEVTLCMLSCFSCVQLFAAPKTVAHQAHLSMDLPGKNTGGGGHALLQGIFLTQGSNLSLKSPALAGRFFITSATLEA